MFYKKKYLAATAEVKELKDAVTEREIAIRRLKQNHDALLDENVNLGKIAETCRKKEEAALMKVGALEGEVAALEEELAALEEELAKAKYDNMVAAETLASTTEELDKLSVDIADMLAQKVDCEGCYFKATKNYRKCNSCTRNTKAVDKYITEADFFASKVILGEEPTPEEAASATDMAELHEETVEVEVDVAELHEGTVEVDAAEPAQASEPTSDAEPTPKPSATKSVKKIKKKNRKKK